MDPRQLEAFAAVMSVGSVTGAARLLGRSQPAVTRLVQELEAEIGYPLLVRHGPRVAPTEQGFLLYGDVERALGGLRRIRQRAAEIARGAAQPLLLAATSACALGLVPEALRSLEAGLGAQPVELRSASPEEVVHAVLHGTAQLGASSLPLEHRGLRVHWIGEAPCVAVLPADDPLAACGTVPLAALAARRLITMRNPFRLRGRLDTVLAQAGGGSAPSAARIETNSSANAQSLVRAGLGVAVLEPLTVRGAPLDGVAVRPIDTDIPFYFGVVSLQARALPAPLEALSGAMLDAARALPGFVRHDPADHGALIQSAHAAAAPDGAEASPPPFPDSLSP